MHEEEARCHGIRLHYQLIDLDQAAAEAIALPTILVAASAMGFTGLNITHPYNQTVIPVLDEWSDEALVIVSNDVAASISSASGLIHATPNGMEKFPVMPIPAELLRPELWVSEIVYFPIETALLRAARACGCVTLDGSDMAIGQAARAFGLFTGIAPHAARMERHFHRMLAAR